MASPKNFDFTPPSKEFAQSFIKPFKFYFHPTFYGLDELDVSRPAMYVSNHTILGILDGYPFGIELYLKKGVFLRALADTMHFKIPYWRQLITERLGVVEASRENCNALMKRGDSIVVYPGGAREVCKKKGEAYELKWTDRTGFVRMAISHGYDIVPVAAIGAEEAYTVVKDANDFLDRNFIGKWMKKAGWADSLFKGGDILPPAVKGIGNSILPRPEKLYFSFGERIETKKFKGMEDDKDVQLMMKTKVELALLKEFHKLFEIRANDKHASLIRRLLTRK